MTVRREISRGTLRSLKEYMETFLLVDLTIEHDADRTVVVAPNAEHADALRCLFPGLIDPRPRPGDDPGSRLAGRRMASRTE
jgi:hypothetical protein